MFVEREKREYLLESIVAPSAKIVDKYDTVTVLLDMVLIASGVLSHEEIDELVLNQLDGIEVSVSRWQVFSQSKRSVTWRRIHRHSNKQRPASDQS